MCSDEHPPWHHYTLYIYTHISNPSSLSIVWLYQKVPYRHLKVKVAISPLQTTKGIHSRLTIFKSTMGTNGQKALSLSLSLSHSTKLIWLQFEGCGTYLGGVRHQGCIMNGVYVYTQQVSSDLICMVQFPITSPTNYIARVTPGILARVPPTAIPNPIHVRTCMCIIKVYMYMCTCMYVSWEGDRGWKREREREERENYMVCTP